MNFLRLVYWLVTGALLGLGVVEFAGLGLILLPIGLVLLIIGLVALRGREVVAGIVGFGALPTAAFAYAITPFYQPCAPSREIWRLGALPPCGALIRPPEFYIYGLIVFSAITVVGVIALIVVARTAGRGSRA